MDSNTGAGPTISIYQNPDHVSGILQQLHRQPLLTDETRELGAGNSTDDKTENKGHAGGKASVNIPGVVDVGADASGDRGRTHDETYRADSKTTLNFKFSQAWYLQEVRNTLRERYRIKDVRSAADAGGLNSGDFVEFQAIFRPSVLHSLLDILTPDLIAALTDHQVKNAGLKLYPEYADIDKLKIFSEELFLKAKIRSDIARATAEAVRVDFRAAKTREFYGKISDVTAITICESAHFEVDDEDRILDGEFSVLGKVTSRVEHNLPILSRNKVLDRLSPELVDSLAELLRDKATSEAVKLNLRDGEQEEIENAFDLAFPSRIEGPSFKVVPIAIFT